MHRDQPEVVIGRQHQRQLHARSGQGIARGLHDLRPRWLIDAGDEGEHRDRGAPDAVGRLGHQAVGAGQGGQTDRAIDQRQAFGRGLVALDKQRRQVAVGGRAQHQRAAGQDGEFGLLARLDPPRLGL